MTYKPLQFRSFAPPLADKVLHVRVVTGSGGGPDKTILRSSKYAQAINLPMAVAYIRPKGDQAFASLVAQAQQHHCPLIDIPEPGPWDTHCFKQLLKTVRQEKITIWHAHDYKSNMLGLLINKFYPLKLVSTVHGWTGETWRTRLYYHLDNHCLKRYDHVIAVSPKLFDHCIEHGVAHDKLSYIPNGIILNDYPKQYTITQARQQLSINPDAFVIGVVGRLSKEKGVDRAIQTANDLLVSHRQVQLHIIGDGPEMPTLVRQANALGIEKSVYFHGWQTQLNTYYQAMDMLLLPSKTEGLPNVVLEAMALGVAVAATHVGAVPDLLDQGRCGVILQTDDHTTWPQQILPLLVSPKRRKELVRRSRLRVASKFCFDLRMDHVFKIYERVTGRSLRYQPSPDASLSLAA